MGRAWQALRALRLRLLGPAKELVGTDQFGNKYYRVPQHQTGAGRHGVSPQVASLWPGLSAVVQPAAARVVRRPRRGLQGTPPRAEGTAPGSGVTSPFVRAESVRLWRGGGRLRGVIWFEEHRVLVWGTSHRAARTLHSSASFNESGMSEGVRVHMLQSHSLSLYSFSCPLGVFYTAAPHADLCHVVRWIRSIRCKAAVFEVSAIPEVQGQAHISSWDTSNVSCSCSASWQFPGWFCCTLFEGLAVKLNTTVRQVSGKVIWVRFCQLCVVPLGYYDSGTIPGFLCFSFIFWFSLCCSLWWHWEVYKRIIKKTMCILDKFVFQFRGLHRTQFTNWKFFLPRKSSSVSLGGKRVTTAATRVGGVDALR